MRASAKKLPLAEAPEVAARAKLRMATMGRLILGSASLIPRPAEGGATAHRGVARVGEAGGGGVEPSPGTA